MCSLKVVGFINRRPDFSLPEFSRYWRTVHKAHALKLVDAGFIRGYIQNHRVEAALDGFRWMADGAPELWVDDAGAFARLAASAEYRDGAGPDEANFMVPPGVACVAQEHVAREVDAPARLDGAVKLMLVFARCPAGRDAADVERWLRDPEPTGLRGSAPLRLTRYVAADEGGGPIGAVECSWWDSLATLEAAWAGRERALLDAGDDAGPVRGMVVREEVVVPAGIYAEGAARVTR